ncbi:MAG: hypothetical protein AAF492_29100, partial [Verrucomicrobiota bacterium]
DVAETVLRTMKKRNPPLRVPATIDARIFYYVRRLLPRRLLHPTLFHFLPGARHWADDYTHARKRFWHGLFSLGHKTHGP